MDPLLQKYAKTVHESLEDVPNELQELISRIREYDVQITNILTEIEGEDMSGDRALLLNQAYKYKSDFMSDVVKLLDDKLYNLDSCYTEVKTAPKLVVHHKAPGEIINSVPRGDLPINKPVSKHRRKQPHNEIVRIPTHRRVSSPAMPSPSKEYPNTNRDSICICKGKQSDHTIICHNDQCKVGTYHMACVGVKSRTEGVWFCNWCIHKIDL
ncbi:Inhibitor of growth protein 4 [Oopsacas minuta]|uniref:Inhibitor of growth protein 4 n=1 Tax=Oopsacas minuta TaxID=111878 RepID=A0AAV7KK87_9METZ|nr:Inhibitor of growth protein 4 [Oopsacas minuta]